MKKPRILIVRQDRIGDTVLSTHLPREIKKKVPESFVAVMLRDYTKDIFLNNPHVDEILTYPLKTENKQSTFWSEIVRLKKYNFSHAFMLLPDERINWLLFLSGVKIRVGVGHKFYQFITNTKSVYRRKYIPLRHEADYCADHIRKIGIEPEHLDPEIYLTVEEKAQSNNIKKAICPNGELAIGINSTSGNSSPNMSPSEYLELTKLLLQKENGIKIIITDLYPPKELSGLQNVFYLNQGKQLRESIVNFSALDLLISASTGPMHICAALKVPTISLFCPLPACSPKLWGPLGNKAAIILPEENYCTINCPGDPKLCNFSGAGGIDAKTVYKTILNTI